MAMRLEGLQQVNRAMRMGMPVSMTMAMTMIVMRIFFEVNIELHAFDAGLLRSFGMQVITTHLEFAQFAFKRFEIDAEIEHGADEHVAADPAKDIEVKCIHITIPQRGR